MISRVMTLHVTLRPLLLLFVLTTISMKPSCHALQVLWSFCRRRRGCTTAANLGRSAAYYYASASRQTPCDCPSMKVLFSSISGNADETLKTLAPGASYMAEMEVKKSRFLGYASHANTWEEAKSYIEQVKSEHPKARHWCYGWCGGHNPVTERCSDDGEPSGTAGAPILNALRGEGMSDVVCVVVRYFGGVKLGAGGLIRAYGAAARQVLREAPVETLVPTITVQVTVGAEYIGTVYELVAKVNGTAGNEDYGADGKLTVKIMCEASDEDRLRLSLRDATKGSVIIT